MKVSRQTVTQNMTLRQLRDIISSVYASKAQHDMKCQEMKEAPETMEQHLYAFLGKRHGLKSVMQDWASSIFRAIQKFAPRENDVAVFGKILQNTIAESFPSVADTCRQTVTQLLKSHLEERHPQRPQAEIEALWRARLRCGVPLSECGEVIAYMYNDNDSEELMARLVHASTEATTDAGDVGLPLGPLSPDSVRLKDLMFVLLTFQMGLTEAFLSDFVHIFKQVDVDCDGVLDGPQLGELVQKVSYVESVADGSPAATVMLEAKANAATAVRRFRKGATFSQSVDLLTALIGARWDAINQE